MSSSFLSLLVIYGIPDDLLDAGEKGENDEDPHGRHGDLGHIPHHPELHGLLKFVILLQGRLAGLPVRWVVDGLVSREGAINSY